mmetsp:Transcript_3617/g.7907  ORF Transcript_3617/g.7907 Transcript_3617/m.7907 type:complete len:363 (-) Transcript_3617:328-1416(-)
MLGLRIPRLVQGVGNPRAVESLVAARPGLFDLGQSLVGAVQDVGNGGDGHVVGDLQPVDDGDLFLDSRRPNDADHEGSTDGIDRRLGFLLCSDRDDDLEADRPGGQCQLCDVLYARQQFEIEDDRLRTDGRRLGDLDLVDDHVAVDDGNGPGNLVRGAALLLDKGRNVGVVASSHPLVGQDGDSGRTELTELAAEQIGRVGGEPRRFLVGGPVDVDVTVGAIGDLALVLGDHRDSPLAPGEALLEGSHFLRSLVLVAVLLLVQGLLDDLVAFHDVVRDSVFFEVFAKLGFLCLADQAAHREQSRSAGSATSAAFAGCSSSSYSGETGRRRGDEGFDGKEARPYQQQGKGEGSAAGHDCCFHC